MKAMKEMFPECRRRICNVHYYRNFSAEDPGRLLYILGTINLDMYSLTFISFQVQNFICFFRQLANAYNEHVHKQTMEAIKKESMGAYE